MIAVPKKRLSILLLLQSWAWKTSLYNERNCRQSNGAVGVVVNRAKVGYAVTVSSTEKSTILQPSYRIPIVLIMGGVGLGALLWIALGIGPAAIAGVVALFGLFLLYQASTLRLVFTETDLDIYRGETRIRRFPYEEWEIWDIFWTPVPVLFYFREVNSIHFLPILFNPDTLRSQLEQHVPNQVDDRK